MTAAPARSSRTSMARYFRWRVPKVSAGNTPRCNEPLTVVSMLALPRAGFQAHGGIDSHSASRLGASVFANGALVLSENDVIHENTMPAAAVEAVEALLVAAPQVTLQQVASALATTRWKQLAMRTTRSVTRAPPQGEESWVTCLIRSAGEPEIVLLPCCSRCGSTSPQIRALCVLIHIEFATVQDLVPCRQSILSAVVCYYVQGRTRPTSQDGATCHSRLRAPHGAGRNGRPS